MKCVRWEVFYVCLLFIPAASAADDCGSLVDAALAGRNTVRAQVVTMGTAVGGGSFADFQLGETLGDFVGYRLTGEARQYFSDRTGHTWWFFGGSQPFDASKTDKLGVEIVNSPPSFAITFFLLSYEEPGQSWTKRMELDHPVCSGGLIVAFGGPNVGGAVRFIRHDVYYVIKFLPPESGPAPAGPQ